MMPLLEEVNGSIQHHRISVNENTRSIFKMPLTKTASDSADDGSRYGYGNGYSKYPVEADGGDASVFVDISMLSSSAQDRE